MRKMEYEEMEYEDMKYGYSTVVKMVSG